MKTHPSYSDKQFVLLAEGKKLGQKSQKAFCLCRISDYRAYGLLLLVDPIWKKNISHIWGSESMWIRFTKQETGNIMNKLSQDDIIMSFTSTRRLGFFSFIFYLETRLIGCLNCFSQTCYSYEYVGIISTGKCISTSKSIFLEANGDFRASQILMDESSSNELCAWAIVDGTLKQRRWRANEWMGLNIFIRRLQIERKSARVSSFPSPFVRLPSVSIRVVVALSVCPS